MELLTDVRMWAALIGIILIEAVLGIDNLVYLALLTDRQPEGRRMFTERLGLGIALLCRLALLGFAVILTDLVQPVFTIFGQAVSWRDMALVTGGVLLLVKGTQEIHGVLEGPADDLTQPPAIDESPDPQSPVNWGGVAQIVVINLSFALDSVGTAFALSGNGLVMLSALILSTLVLLAVAAPLSALLTRHPTIRVLAMSYLLLLGAVLIAQGLGYFIPKEYILFALGLSASVAALELTFHKK